MHKIIRALYSLTPTCPVSPLSFVEGFKAGISRREREQDVKVIKCRFLTK
jgi:hypothetical protein